MRVEVFVSKGSHPAFTKKKNLKARGRYNHRLSQKMASLHEQMQNLLFQKHKCQSAGYPVPVETIFDIFQVAGKMKDRESLEMAYDLIESQSMTVSHKGFYVMVDSFANTSSFEKTLEIIQHFQ